MNSSLVERLPSVRSWEFSFRADEAQRLSPMPTKAFHGALGHALRRLACLHPRRRVCDACPTRADCAYASLFEPSLPPQPPPGVTNRAPSPFVLAPVGTSSHVLQGSPTILEPGDTWKLRLGLVGDRAISHLSIVRAALERAGRRGIGIRPDVSARKESTRPALLLESVEPSPEPFFPSGGPCSCGGGPRSACSSEARCSATSTRRCCGRPCGGGQSCWREPMAGELSICPSRRLSWCSIPARKWSR